KGKTENEIWSIADPFAERIMSAVTKKDIDAFSADFTVRIKSLLTQEIFDEMVDRFERDYGHYQKRRRVCVMNNPHCTPVIWAINFDNTPLDILFQIRLVYEEGNLLTDSALFRTWMI
ncbi:MAG: hypothetical protein H7Z77_09590, partial [Chitinophagaceae bacterium]|nr:hypothetical protein [Polaromonas sp.]